MKKLLILYILFTSLLVGCGIKNSTTYTEQRVIGFSQSGIESSWRKKHTDSIRTELEKEYQVMYRNSYMDQEKQIKDLRSFIAYQVDLIVLSPVEDSGWDIVLEEAKKANIPVIIVDKYITVSNESLYLTHIGPSFKAEGQKGGLFVTNFFSDNTIDTIKILELEGKSTDSTTTLRSDGFHEAIARDPRTEVIDVISGDFIRMKAKEHMQNYINTHDISEVDVLYSHSDEMTLGALEALAETSIIPGVDIIIVSIDGQENMIENLKQGYVNAIIECNPNAGWYVKNTVNRYFDGKTIPKDIYMPETIFSESNINSIPTRNY